MAEGCRLTGSPHLGLSFLAALSALSAQTRITGQVVDADAAPIPRARVLLHRVGEQVQGPIDSTHADRRGRFRFTFQPDSGTFYLVSSRFAGIEYFSQPVETNPARPDTGVRVVVYDTSSMTPVLVDARHLVVTRPVEDGSRSVLDLVVIRNPGRLTRVARDTLGGSMDIALPRGSAGLQVREGDVSPGAVIRAGDTAIVSAALSPGEKQLTLEYRVPNGENTLDLPLSAGGLTLNILLEEPGSSVTGPGISAADRQEIQGRSFRRWSGTVTSRGTLQIVLPRTGRGPRWLLAALVTTMALGLLVAGWYGLTRLKPVPQKSSLG